ncbi:MAG: hypothetical protein WCG94_02660 [Methanothrix sp.]
MKKSLHIALPSPAHAPLLDPDAGKPLTLFKTIPLVAQPNGGPFFASGRTPMAQLAFFNANGNLDTIGAPIFDDGDVVYFEINPGISVNPIVSPNDIRLY